MVLLDSGKQKYTPKISIIVPVYKVENYIRPCINSILCQTFSDFELILVDDGSPDSCGVICDEYAEADVRISVIHKENGGLSSARNAGLSVMKGQYVAFVDSDDIIHPYMLEVLYTGILKTHSDISMGGVKKFLLASELSTDKQYNLDYSIIDNRDALYQLCRNQNWFPVVCNKLYKASLFTNVFFPVGRIHEDEAVMHRLLFAAKTIAVNKSPIYFYRSREFSITQSDFSMACYDKVKAFMERHEFFSEHGENELSEMSKRSAQILIAKYALRARSMGIYRQIEKPFKISVIKSLRIIRRNCSEQNYEWWLNEVHPMLLRIYIYWKRIKSLLT